MADNKVRDWIDNGDYQKVVRIPQAVGQLWERELGVILNVFQFIEISNADFVIYLAKDCKGYLLLDWTPIWK